VIIWSIAKTTVGEAMRKKVLQIFLVVAMGLIIISLSFSQTLEFSSGGSSSTDIMLVKSFGLGLMAVAGWLISLVMGVSLIPQEIERRTIYTILSKPVKRYEFILGKYLGAVMTLAINIGLMGAVFMAVVIFKAWGAHVPVASPTAGITDAGGSVQVGLFDWNTLWGIIMIYFQFVVLSSVVLFFSVMLTPTVNFFMGLGVYIVGVMAPLTQTLAESKNANALLKGFYTVIHAIVPNFDKFNLVNPLIHPESQAVPMQVYLVRAVLYAILYSLLMMLFAVIAFRRKEV
jgi:ABC-type transport system involved in multi-copper enzyme maturation permease subunit